MRLQMTFLCGSVVAGQHACRAVPTHKHRCRPAWPLHIQHLGHALDSQGEQSTVVDPSKPCNLSRIQVPAGLTSPSPHSDDPRTGRDRARLKSSLTRYVYPSGAAWAYCSSAGTDASPLRGVLIMISCSTAHGCGGPSVHAQHPLMQTCFNTMTSSVGQGTTES